MNRTLREWRDDVVAALKTEGAVAVTGVPAANVEAGRIDGNTEFVLPAIAVYIFTGDGRYGEKEKIRMAGVEVFCLVAPETDAAAAEINALEMTERVEKILKEEFHWIKAGMPEIDGSYSDYSVASITLFTPYKSSAL